MKSGHQQVNLGLYRLIRPRLLESEISSSITPKAVNEENSEVIDQSVELNDLEIGRAPVRRLQNPVVLIKENKNREAFVLNIKFRGNCFLRYNTDNNRFEGYHNDANKDYLDQNWRPLTSNIATNLEAGVIKVGSNLNINTTTGFLSSVATGESRIYQQVITVSNNTNAGDYLSITTAINEAIGTSSPWNTGSITSNSSYGAPSISNPYVILVSPGTYTERVNLPPYVSLQGEGPQKTRIKLSGGGSDLEKSTCIVGATYSTISDLTIELDANGSAYATGIYSNSSNTDVNVKNVEIIDSGKGIIRKDCFVY